MSHATDAASPYPSGAEPQPSRSTTAPRTTSLGSTSTSQRNRNTMSRELVRHEPKAPATLAPHQVVIPATIADEGERAAHRFFEFFTANIRNPNTRRAYHRAALAF